MVKVKTSNKPAVIYCRVSSDRQAREGSGLSSQETRCREYAAQNGYDVIKVFKDEGISGGLLPYERPGATALLSFLERQKENFFVITDSVDRIARSQQAFVEFAGLISLRKAQFVSPNHKFGDAPPEEFVTEIMVSVASLQRKENRKRVIDRQHARLQNGFWPFQRPKGYKFVKSRYGGKILEQEEPAASTIREAFEGFASGRFESQVDVAAFLDRSGVFSSTIYPTRIRSILTNPLYAGYVEYSPWKIERREGQHEPIVDPDTFFRVQERLGLKAKAPYRKDLSPDFPLRGFVLCSECSQPLTAAWSTARDKTKHPYYRCKTKGCSLCGKGLRRELLHDDMSNLLEKMKPSTVTLGLLENIVQDIWQNKRREHLSAMKETRSELEKIDEEIGLLMEKHLRTNDDDLLEMYESYLKALKHKKQAAMALSDKMGAVDTSLGEALGTVIEFISNPAEMWQTGDLEEQRLVLKMAFVEQLSFDKKSGFGTSGKALPFEVLGALATNKSQMVEGTGFEPVYS